ncbi:hypothetical protein KSX_29600 [Ktedonospora formicarum]|uniref:histidine kinase n=2 Tax=Ktedonospora formicarum TaxID=2778364 RepID=A0A8J3I209_9CHLR|nr:hypothetical protein KSX_29600 [Ktedonospora formicarum]
MDATLEVLRRFLDCQTLFISRVEITPSNEIDGANQHTLKIMGVRNQGTSQPARGGERALDETYCHTIWQTHQPLIVEDSTRSPFYQKLLTTKDYNIGSYIGVPLIYSDGRIYGTLCSQDSRPRPLMQQPEKLELMQIMARFLISHIEREELTTQLREAECAQAELARKEREAHMEADRHLRELNAILDAMGDGMLVSNRDGQLRVNEVARQILSVIPDCKTLEEFLARQQERTVVWDENTQPVLSEQLPIVRVLNGEHLVGEKMVMVQRENAQGVKRFLSVSGMPIYDEQEHVNGCVLIFRDIHERYLLQRQTQELNTRFNEFLSIASHELKGPLTAFKGNIQLAQRALRRLMSQHQQEHDTSINLLEKIQRYLERAEHQVRLQTRLTSDMLDVSRIRAGTLALYMQRCDLKQVVKEIVEDQRQVAEGRRIDLELPTADIFVHGDAERLGQVVNNYLTNACKYSASDKSIKVTVITEGMEGRVIVSDQGPGLTLDEQTRVWERFYRSKDISIMSGNSIGLGLGLHICKTIVEQHGGSVGLQSTVGQGSHFWFTLPLSKT